MVTLNLGPVGKFTQGLYADLDSLFDTRFAVLEEISPRLAIENLVNGWQTRKADVPIGMPLEDFQTLYSLRTDETLAKASQTEVLELMRHWVADIVKLSAGSPDKTTVRIFINVFPFELSEKQARELGEQFKAFFPPDVDLTMLNIDPKKITPATAKKYFAGMFMYDYHLWKEHHAKEGNFKDIKLPDTALYTPGIFHGKMPTEAELREYTENKIDIFKEWEMYVGPIIGIEFLPVQVFSTQLPAGLFTDMAALEPFLKKDGSLKDNHPQVIKGI